MILLAFAWFLAVTWGLGASLARRLPEPEEFLERNLVRFALGVGVLPILIVLLDALRVPLVWWVFLPIALTTPVATMGRASARYARQGLRRPSASLVGAVLCAVLLFGVYVYGAHEYPYLEDQDSWTNAASASFVSIEKTVRLDRARLPDHPLYLPPYPPSYAGLMGILHQIDPSMQRTLKVFNSVLVASSILFFFLFAARLLGDKKNAFLATALLTVNPSYLSHFIWATSLGVPLCFVAWYFTERGRQNRWFFGFAGVAVASVLVTSRSVSVIFGLMSAVYWVASLVHDLWGREAKWLARAAWFALPILLGTLLSVALLWAWILPAAQPSAALVAGLSAKENLGYAGTIAPEPIFEKVFTPRDFFVSPVENRIDQPSGWGSAITLLVGLGLGTMLLRWREVPGRYRRLVALGMFAVTIVGVEANALPYRIGYPHRYWAFLAIPAAVIASEGAAALWRRLEPWRTLRAVVAAMFGWLLIATAVVPKYSVETSIWPPGTAWSSPEELRGYLHLRTLPKNQKIFGDCAGSDYKIIGFDQTAPFWREDVQEFRARFARASIEEIDAFLRGNGYRYLVIDSACSRRLGMETAADLLERLRRRYVLAYSTPAFFLFEVR